MESLASPRLLGAGGGENVFQLNYYKIDSFYWLAFVGMIAFCTLIDRGQAFLDYLAEGSETEMLLLQKIYTELLLFGAVAITLFIFSQAAPSFNPEAMTIITFIDILVSIGACTLIALAGIISCLKRIYWVHWSHCEEGHVIREHRMSIISKLAEFYCATSRESYTLMARQFVKEHSVPKIFRYHMYLDKVFSRACCDLMSISWVSWVVLASFGFAGFLFHTICFHAGDAEKTFEKYYIEVVLINWIVFLAHAVLSIYAVKEFRQMVNGLQSGDQVEFPEHPGRLMGLRTEWLLQIIHLTNCFCMAFFQTNVMYNARKHRSEYVFWWDMGAVLPLLLNTFFLLPCTLPRMVIVDSFFMVDAGALDAMVSDLQQTENDMRYVYGLWVENNSPDLLQASMSSKRTIGCCGEKPAEEQVSREDEEWESDEEDDVEEKLIDEKHFAWFMSKLGMHLSPQRIRRLFRVLDADSSGGIEIREFQSYLHDMGVADGQKLMPDHDTLPVTKRIEVLKSKIAENKAAQERLCQELFRAQSELANLSPRELASSS